MLFREKFIKRRQKLQLKKKTDDHVKCRSFCPTLPHVDFKKVGWSAWIVAPKGYEAFFCAGTCPSILSPDYNVTNHAIVQSMIHDVDKRLAGPACCIPTEMASLSLLYNDDKDKIVLKMYDDMTVVGCGCR